MSAQSNEDPEYFPHYLGLLPAFLVEPYDTINALEVNIFPLVYEYSFGPQAAFQLRPIINYRFYKIQPGISQTGITLLFNRYFFDLFKKASKIDLNVGPYLTYAYNQLDKINTMTLGGEAGLRMWLSNSFSLNVDLQPGINYYPDEFSRTFVASESGFKLHFGIIVHGGFHF